MANTFENIFQTPNHPMFDDNNKNQIDNIVCTNPDFNPNYRNIPDANSTYFFTERDWECALRNS